MPSPCEMDLFIRVLMVLPLAGANLKHNWALVPTLIYWKIGFVVVISTFITYLLNLLTMKELKPTTVAVFIYLQPVFATVFYWLRQG
jgi:drug/metabolite transporter (DMT)-like permease